ncbi:MAG TPA: hypothetical protein VL463_03825 [Kofleriaceae bacterium]|jgi:hypothetical protein|nr:hypothetical protein [Kofleriaceae bacterium]
MDLAEAHRVLNVPFGAPLDQVHAWHRYYLDGWNPEKYKQDPAQYQRAQLETARVNAALATILSSRAVPPAHVIPHNDKKAGAPGMIFGGIALFVVGVAITAGTYDHASQEGGTYFIAYGPMGLGVVLFFQGLVRAMRR